MSHNQDLVRKQQRIFYQINNILNLVKESVEIFYQIDIIFDLVKNPSQFVVPFSAFLRFGKMPINAFY